MRTNWKEAFHNPETRVRHWIRHHSDCVITVVGDPGDTEPTRREGYQIYTYWTGNAYSNGGCVKIPDGVDPDDYADAVAELLHGFVSSLPTRALAMLKDRADAIAEACARC